MEVMVPLQSMDFDFNSARTTPYPTAPSTPRRLGEYYFSAPTSPRHVADFYREFDELLIKIDGDGGGGGSSSAEVPFDWEEKPGTPKSHKGSISMFEDDFAFDLSGEMQRTSLSAEELFDGGVIKPLKPPPRLLLPTGEDGYYFGGQKSPGFSPRSHKSPLAQGKKFIRGAFSPREKKDANPLLAENIGKRELPERERERGRERNYPISSSSRRATRSVSPIRVSEYQWVDEQTKQSTANQKPPSASTTSALSTFSKGFKWRLKDLFLFRSASDGRAMARDPLKKYSTFIRKQQEDLRNASSRSIESPRPGSSSRRRGKNVSAHEKHYTANRAYSEDMKKKTFLPYKQGILGRLSFNPTVSYGLGGFSRN